MLVAGIGAIVLFAVVIIAYGYYDAQIAPKSATVLRVGDQDFSYSYLERRVEDRLPDGPVSGDTIGAVIIATLQRLQREELIRQTAAAQNITASDAEVETRMRERVGLEADASREALASLLRLELLASGLSISEYRELAHVEVLEDKLRERYDATAPATADHANLRLIQVQTQQTANEVKERLNRGEEFGTVASAVSVHSSKTAGGELGWVPRGAQATALEEFAFNQTGVSDVITIDNIYYIVESRGMEPREVTADGKEDIVNRSLSDALAKTREEIGSETKLTNTQVQRLARSILDRRG
jgi:foldase protein PrsA